MRFFISFKPNEAIKLIKAGEIFARLDIWIDTDEINPITFLQDLLDATQYLQNSNYIKLTFRRSPKSNKVEPQFAEYIAALLKSGSFPKNLVVDFLLYPLEAADIRIITDAMKSVSFSEKVIIAPGVIQQDEGIQEIVKVFENPPSNMGLDFHLCHLTTSSVGMIVDSLLTNTFPEGLFLRIEHDIGAGFDLDENGLQNLDLAKTYHLLLNHPKLASNFCLSVEINRLYDENSLYPFLACLTNGVLKEGFELSLIVNYYTLTNAFWRKLGEALANKNLPENFKLKMDMPEYAVKIILDTLIENGCSKGFELVLAHLNYPTETQNLVSHISDFIKSGYCPENMTFNLIEDVIEETEFIHLLNALTNKNAPKQISIHMKISNPGLNGINELCKTLQHPNCPESLSITCPIYWDAARNLATVLKSDLGSKELKLFFVSNGGRMKDEDKQPLLDALKHNINVTEFSLDGVATTQEENLFIQHVCQRNRLIRQFPEFESFLEELSYKLGYYAEKPKEPQSLKCQTTSYLLFNKKEIPVNYPPEIKEYIAFVDFLYKQMLPQDVYKKRMIGP